MTLADVVSRFEAGEPGEGDFEHELASLVMEELAHCEESEQQAVLFTDARNVSDELLAQYLRLDQEDKARMAEAYASEKCFRRVGGVMKGTRIRLRKKLSAKNLKLLLHISSYSKLIQILENYVHFVEQCVDKRRTSSLPYYLTHYTPDGKKARRNSTKGSLNLVRHYDFRANKIFDRKKAEAVFESLTWGVPVELRQRVRDAVFLKPLRERILENYVRFVEESDDININTSSLIYYFSAHDIGSRKVRKNSRNSFYRLLVYDFRKNRMLKKRISQDVFESLAFGVSEDLKQRVRDAMSLLPVRRRILENYVRYIEESDDIKVANSRLYFYCLHYRINGEPADNFKQSAHAFYGYDFRKMKGAGRQPAKSAFESLTFGIDDELKQRVRDAMSLLSVRTMILQNYVGYIEGSKDAESLNSSFHYYLMSHDIEGEEAEFKSEESLRRFYNYDFKNQRVFRKKSAKSIFESLTHGIKDKVLVEKVMRYSGVAA